MFHLKNDTPFTSQISVFPNIKGIDTLCVIVKATYDLTPEVHVADQQQPIVTDDTYWGEPVTSSLKYPAEADFKKPGTDVIVVGEACAPNERPVSEISVGLNVAGRIRILQVFGDRYWEKSFLGMKPSRPKPFLRMPIIYERAFGGMHVMDEASGRILVEAGNPMGLGFAGKRSQKELVNTLLPNIEDPEKLMKGPFDNPGPVGYGAIAPYWTPRISFAGTHDEAWQKTRMPFAPEDVDSRFFHAAHPDFIFAEYLKGGEPVVIANLSPRGKQSFNLPAVKPKVEAKITGKLETATVHLETVLLEPTDERVSLTWKAVFTTGKDITGAEVVNCRD